MKYADKAATALQEAIEQVEMARFGHDNEARPLAELIAVTECPQCGEIELGKQACHHRYATALASVNDEQQKEVAEYIEEGF